MLFDFLPIFYFSSITIDEDSSSSIIATFKVPCDATVGDVSTIVVTATSDLDGTQNSAVTRLVVISDVSFILYLKTIIYRQTTKCKCS